MSMKDKLIKAGYKPSLENETNKEGKDEKGKKEKGEKSTNHSLKSAMNSIKCKNCGKVGCTDC